LAISLAAAISKVTKPWVEIKKRADREERAAAARLRARYLHGRTSHITMRRAACEVMPQAYLKASGNGQYPATARQIMYAARHCIQEQTGRLLDDKYFTQTLLPDFIKEHPEQTADWDVVFDARGHLSEPHTATVIGIGTLEVRQYLSEEEDPIYLGVSEPTVMIKTKGPTARYGSLLYIEKEGFIPLLEAAKIPERYDLAIASSKGLSSTAARGLVENLSQKVKILAVHDFDKAGFSILGTLQRNTRRYTFEHMPAIIDLGLRLDDVKSWKLQAEAAEYYRGSDPAGNLEENGATPEEIEFLRKLRVELNAFTSEQFLAWLEDKFEEHNLKKVIPDTVTLQAAYRKMVAAKLYGQLFDQHHGRIEQQVGKIQPPKNLTRKLAELLRKKPELSWDLALREVLSDKRIEL
jgi:hypothetical protein